MTRNSLPFITREDSEITCTIRDLVESMDNVAKSGCDLAVRTTGSTKIFLSFKPTSLLLFSRNKNGRITANDVNLLVPRAAMPRERLEQQSNIIDGRELAKSALANRVAARPLHCPVSRSGSHDKT